MRFDVSKAHENAKKALSLLMDERDKINVAISALQEYLRPVGFSDIYRTGETVTPRIRKALAIGGMTSKQLQHHLEETGFRPQLGSKCSTRQLISTAMQRLRKRGEVYQCGDTWFLTSPVPAESQRTAPEAHVGGTGS